MATVNGSKKAPRPFCKIWTGLPASLELERLILYNGQVAFRYARNGCYAWVTPEAVQALEKNPKAELTAIGTENKESGMFDYYVDIPRVRDNVLGFNSRSKDVL